MTADARFAASRSCAASNHTGPRPGPPGNSRGRVRAGKDRAGARQNRVSQRGCHARSRRKCVRRQGPGCGRAAARTCFSASLRRRKSSCETSPASRWRRRTSRSAMISARSLLPPPRRRETRSRGMHALLDVSSAKHTAAAAATSRGLQLSCIFSRQKKKSRPKLKKKSISLSRR